MSYLNLCSWEVPSESSHIKGLAHTIETVNWNGQNQLMAIRYVETGNESFCVFMREVDSKDDANWMLYDVESSMPFFSNSKPSVQDLKEIANEINQDRIDLSLQKSEYSSEYSLARLFVVGVTFGDERVEISPILLTSPEGGFITDAENRTSSIFKLSSALYEHTFFNEGYKCIDLMIAEMSNEESDIAFASRWSMLNSLQLLVGKEAKNEIDEIMRYALICQSELWSLSSSWEWSLNTINNGSVSAFDLDKSDEEVEEKYSYLSIIGKVIRDYIREKSVAVRNQRPCAEKSWTEDGISFDVSVENPTAHDRVEALLKLRKWIDGRISAEQSAQLFDH